MLFYFYIFFCLLAYRTHQAVQHFGSTAIDEICQYVIIIQLSYLSVMFFDCFSQLRLNLFPSAYSS